MNTQSFKSLGKLILLIVKIVLCLIIVLFFVAGVPLIINWLYDFREPLIYTEWGPSELLEYYGNLLGTAVTVFTFYFGIRNEFRKTRKEIVNQRQLEVIERLIGLCDELMSKALPERLMMFHSSIKADPVKDRMWVCDLYRKGVQILDEANIGINRFGTSLDTLNVVGLNTEALVDYQKQLISIHLDAKKKHEELMDVYAVYADKDENQRKAEFSELLKTINEYLKIFGDYDKEFIRVKRLATIHLFGLKNNTIEK